MYLGNWKLYNIINIKNTINIFPFLSSRKTFNYVQSTNKSIKLVKIKKVKVTLYKLCPCFYICEQITTQ